MDSIPQAALPLLLHLAPAFTQPTFRRSVVLLFAGKFEDKKRPVALMRAVSELNDPRLVLVLVGDGVLGDEVRRLATGSPDQFRVLIFESFVCEIRAAEHRVADSRVQKARSMGKCVRAKDEHRPCDPQSAPPKRYCPAARTVAPAASEPENTPDFDRQSAGAFARIARA